MVARVWIPSPNYSSSRARSRLLVVHTSEGATTFRSLGNFLANPANEVSYHVGFDDTTNSEIGEYVKPPNKSWSAHSANNEGEHGCCCTPSGASSGWSRADWLARPRMLDACAAWLAEESARYGIPLEKIGGDEIAAGASGVCGHRDCVDAGLGGSHTDPGPNFPWDYVLAGGTPEPEPSWTEDDMRALRTVEDGGIYVFGPGVFELQTGPSWGAWERFTGPALEVNAAQRDMIRATCMGAGAAAWNYPLQSRVDRNKYAAGDILTSAEEAARDAAG